MLQLHNYKHIHKCACLCAGARVCMCVKNVARECESIHIPNMLSFKEFKTAFEASFLAVFLSDAGQECLCTTPFATTSMVIEATPPLQDVTAFFLS